MATKKAVEQKATTITDRLEDTVVRVGSSAKDLNDYILKSTENVMDVAFDRGAQWQKLSGKAIDKGFELASAQQDIVFDALEVAKGQLAKGRERFKALFN